jgi:hypothetical protein
MRITQVVHRKRPGASPFSHSAVRIPKSYLIGGFWEGPIYLSDCARRIDRVTE